MLHNLNDRRILLKGKKSQLSLCICCWTMSIQLGKKANIVSRWPTCFEFEWRTSVTDSNCYRKPVLISASGIPYFRTAILMGCRKSFIIRATVFLHDSCRQAHNIFPPTTVVERKRSHLLQTARCFNEITSK